MRQLVRGAVVCGYRLLNTRELDDYYSLIFYSLERFYGSAANQEPGKARVTATLRVASFHCAEGVDGVLVYGSLSWY
jgi:hypothetical protein